MLHCCIEAYINFKEQNQGYAQMAIPHFFLICLHM